jgi:hypothetical protein
MAAPIVLTHAWRAVVDASGRRCECPGGCGHRHSGPDGRCPVDLVESPGARLIVAARDVSVPPSRAPWLPVAELAAWCEPCLSGMQAKVRAAQRKSVTAPQVGPDLFTDAALLVGAA